MNKYTGFKAFIAISAGLMALSAVTPASAAYYYDQYGRAVYYETYTVPGGQFYPPAQPQYGYNANGTSYGVVSGGSYNTQYGYGYNTASAYGYGGNRAPVIFSSPVRDAIAGESYVAGINATDLDNDPLTYQLVTGPSGMNINQNTGLLRMDNTSGKGGQTFTVTVGVTDGRSPLVTQTYQLTFRGAGSGSTTSSGTNTSTGSSNGNYTGSIYGSLFGKKAPKALDISAVNVISGPKTIGDNEDRNCEVYVSWNTNIAAAGGVLYGTVSQENVANYVYTQTAPEGNSYVKEHQVKLGCLSNDSTVFFRVFGVSADAQRVVTKEYTIFPVTIRTQIPGAVNGFNLTPSDSSGNSASVLSLIGGIIFNPIVIILLAIVLIWIVALRILKHYNTSALRHKKKQEAAAHAAPAAHVAHADAHSAPVEIPMLQVPHN